MYTAERRMGKMRYFRQSVLPYPLQIRSMECLPLFRRNVNLMERNIYVIIRRDDFTSCFDRGSHIQRAIRRLSRCSQFLLTSQPPSSCFLSNRAHVFATGVNYFIQIWISSFQRCYINPNAGVSFGILYRVSDEGLPKTSIRK